jgi:hypothetical protein
LIDEDAGYHFRPGREHAELAQQGGTVVVDVYEGEFALFYANLATKCGTHIGI